MGSDSIKSKSDLEPFHTAIFPSRGDWIRGPKAPTYVQGFAWFTDNSWTQKGSEVGTYGSETRLCCSVGKRRVKEGSGKGQLSPQVAPLWKTGGGLTCRRL